LVRFFSARADAAEDPAAAKRRRLALAEKVGVYGREGRKDKNGFSVIRNQREESN